LRRIRALGQNVARRQSAPPPMPAGQPDRFAGLTPGTHGLLAGAGAAARSLGSPAIGSGDLLVALLLADEPPARLLGAGVAVGDVRAAVARSRPRETGAGGAPAYTDELWHVVAVACRHAVIFESEDVTPEHLLLASPLTA
jgi:Clp amino terminal domain, pathogenicity island component